MKNVRNLIALLLLVAFASCDLSKPKSKSEAIDSLIEIGEFKQAEELLSSLITKLEGEGKVAVVIQLETLSRIRKEFPYTRADVKEQFAKYYPNLSDTELNEWEELKQLEMRIIDGDKRYFKRSASNFFRLNAEAKALKESISGVAYDGVDDFQLNEIPKYFENEIEAGKPFNSRQIKVNYTIRLKPNKVPAGKIVRCWLPYPRTGSKRLSSVEFLNANQKDFIIAPNETMQRTVYMEKPAVKDEETVFNISYVFNAAAQWFNVKADQVLPYDKSSEFYKTFTAERLPNIIFSEEVTTLAKEIVGVEANSVKQVELLYYWIHENITWTGALEYSTIPCIPAYVLGNMRGDCGMKTFLFLSMARSVGIPCKWQSGWYLLPQEKNLHDWAEVYYEGIGWVPVDLSFGLINSDDKRVKEFYLKGLDNYRLVVNDDYSQELFPPKKYYRSEPYDFQRGELEWEGGNLYFHTWSYKMEVDYLD